MADESNRSELFTATAEESAFSRLLTELPDAVVIINANGRLRWANRAAETLFGRTLHDSMDLSGLELVHPEDLELVLRSLESVHTKTVGSPIEVRLNTSAGWRLTELVGTAIPWLEQGAVIISLRDLTERRRFELAYDEDSRFRSLVQSAATITMLISPSGAVRSVSGALTRLLGHDPELVEGRPLLELVDVADRRAAVSWLERAAQGASAANPATVRVRLLRHNGTGSVPFELALVNLVADPTVDGYVVSGHDITAQVHAEREVQKTVSLLNATLDSTADGILVVDTAGRFVKFNQRFADLWRLPESVLATSDDATAIAFVQDQLVDPDAFVTKVNELYANLGAESHDTLEFKDGRVFERASKPQSVDNEIVGRVWSFRDITDRKRLEERLYFQAFHDSLTGLANRPLFLDRLQHAVERVERTAGLLAVLFVDLDSLKLVNDGLGHAAGDELLGLTADLLAGCLRSADTLARLGGDEFGILAEDLLSRGDAIDLANRILNALRRPVHIVGQEVSSTASIGLTFYSPGISPDQLLSNADLAMYTAKRAGGNGMSQFEVAMPLHVR